MRNWKQFENRKPLIDCQHTKSHHVTDDIRQCDVCGQQFRQALVCPESRTAERREAILQSLADLQSEDARDEAREVMRDLESERD